MDAQQTANMADLAAATAAIEQLTCRSIQEYRTQLGVIRKKFPRANIWGAEYVRGKARILVFPSGKYKDGEAFRTLFRPLPSSYKVSTW